MTRRGGAPSRRWAPRKKKGCTAVQSAQYRNRSNRSSGGGGTAPPPPRPEVSPAGSPTERIWDVETVAGRGLVPAGSESWSLRPCEVRGRDSVARGASWRGGQVDAKWWFGQVLVVFSIVTSRDCPAPPAGPAQVVRSEGGFIHI
jgi:hypothetical protein